MTTSTTTITKLPCTECRRENEPERIYCHDCGARLDRSTVIQQKAKEEEDPTVEHRRVREMFNPRRAKLRHDFFLAAKAILAGVAVAGLVQMLRPPELPEARPSTGILPAQINFDLENATMDARPAPLRYSEQQVNAYLSYSLRSKQAVLSKYLKFERALVKFDEGSTCLTVERSLYGFSVFTTAAISPQLADGAIRVKCGGGAIGRLPIHPVLMQYGDFLFGDVREAVGRDRKSLSKLGSIELHPQTILITPPMPKTVAVAQP